MSKFVSFLFLITGIALLFTFSRILFFYIITIKKWKKAEGFIIEADSSFYQSETDVDTQGWKLMVRYSYTTDEGKFINNEISKNTGSLVTYPGWVDKKEYEVGKSVWVYYNPKRHSDSVLENKFGYGSLVPLIFGTIAITVAYVNLFD